MHGVLVPANTTRTPRGWATAGQFAAALVAVYPSDVCAVLANAVMKFLTFSAARLLPVIRDRGVVLSRRVRAERQAAVATWI